MCNWSQGVMEEGVQRGIKQGIKQGLDQGRDQERINILKNLLSNGMSFDTAVKMIGIKDKKDIDFLRKHVLA